MVRGPGQQRGLDAAPGGRLRGSDDREHHGAYAGYRRRWGPHPGQPADSPAPQQHMHVIQHHHADHDSATDHLHLLHHDHDSATDHDHLQLDHDDDVHHAHDDHDQLHLHHHEHNEHTHHDHLQLDHHNDSHYHHYHPHFRHHNHN